MYGLHLCLSAVDAPPPDEFLAGTEVFSPEVDRAAAALEVPRESRIRGHCMGPGQFSEVVLVPIVTTLAHTKPSSRRRADHRLHEIGSLFACERSPPDERVPCHERDRVADGCRRAHALTTSLAASRHQ